MLRRRIYQQLMRSKIFFSSGSRPTDWWPDKPEIAVNAPEVHFSVMLPSGNSTIELVGREGQTIEDILRDQGLIEAACDGNCQCSTCHVFVPSVDDRQRLPPVEEFELDMLELASEYEHDPDASRLSCQLTLSPKLNGLRIRLPSKWTNYMDHIPY
mmetsp:Transcript_3309/g.4595  ORF Transcript_3309/g.4595 Transcript_3309/m.4595 type:complete len:156 (+) Transcript_3309:61-528(+)